MNDHKIFCFCRWRCLALGCILLFVVASTGPGNASHGNLKQSDEPQDVASESPHIELPEGHYEYWLTRMRASFSKTTHFAGPFVLSREGGDSYIWLLAYDWRPEITGMTPFVIIIPSKENVRHLTSFQTVGKQEGSILTTGVIDSGFAVFSFSHEFIMDIDDPNHPLEERFTVGSKNWAIKKEFDLEDGRVFELRHDVNDGKSRLVQLSAKLPPKETLYSVMTIESTKEKSYKLFSEWHEGLREKGVSDGLQKNQ